MPLSQVRSADTGGPATATDLAGRLPITRQAIAKHLALLAEAGLVTAEPGERRRVRYRLRSAPMQVAQQFLAALARDWDGPLGALQEHLDQQARPWASSYGSDFNFDFGVAHTKEEWEAGAVVYNFGEQDLRPAAGESSSLDAFSESIAGTDWQTFRREGPGMSAFVLDDGTIYHTYSTYGRGLDILWGMYQWLDRAPLGRNEAGMWWRRYDEYDNQ